MSEPSDSSDGLRRLHPASPVFQILSQLRGMIAPLIVFVVSPPAVRLAMLFFVGLGFAVPVVRYFSYRYRFGEDELMVREGLLRRNERRVPYDRIQNLDLVQNPLHRVFKVAEVRLETASGSQAEAVMRVLSMEAVEELRTVINDRSTDSAAIAAETSDSTALGAPERARGRLLLRLPLAEIVRLGLVSNRGMVVIAAFVGFFFQQADMLDWDDLAPRFAQWVTDRLPESLDPSSLEPTRVETSWLPWLVMALLGGLVALGLLYALSIGLAILRFYDFTLRLVGDQLRSEFGLLTRAAATTPRRRIQRLRIRSGVVERLLDRAAIRVDTAGGSSAGSSGDPFSDASDGGLQRSKQWLAPILPRAEVNHLIEQALPDVRPEPLRWEPIAQRAWKREFRQGLLVLSVVILPAALFTLWALLGVLLVPVLAYLSRRTVASIAWGLDANALHVRSGWLRHRRGIVRLSKVQSVLIRRSPFDRRHRMAALRVDTAGSGSEYAVHLPYLEEDTAQRLAAMLNREAATRHFLWT